MGGDHERTLDLRKRQHGTSLRADDLITTLPVMVSDVAVGTFELSDPEFWIAPRDYRHAAFRSLRQADELMFFDEWEYEDSPIPEGPGYWAVTRHEDVWAASRNPHVFISGKGVNIGDIPQEMNEFFGSMITMDDPRHFRLRNIVAKGFTPKQITQVEGYVRTKATAIVDRLLEHFPDGECDFVERDRRAAPPADHLRDDGHPRSDEAPDLRVDQRDPRRRRPGVRRHVRAADRRADADVRVRPDSWARSDAPTPATTSPRC